jgi:hypothetical protein
MKTISALAMIVAMSLTLPVPAFAQQTVNENGSILDGMGGGSNAANRHRFDGPPNADVNSLVTAVTRLRNQPGNRTALCTVVGSTHCAALQRGDALDYMPYDK